MRCDWCGVQMFLRTQKAELGYELTAVVMAPLAEQQQAAIHARYHQYLAEVVQTRPQRRK